MSSLRHLQLKNEDDVREDGSTNLLREKRSMMIPFLSYVRSMNAQNFIEEAIKPLSDFFSFIKLFYKNITTGIRPRLILNRCFALNFQFHSVMEFATSFT